MLKKFQGSEFCNQIYRTYFLTTENEIFAVLTDTFHKPGFKLHVLVLQHLFCLVETGLLTEPLWDVTTTSYSYSNNAAFVREYTIKLLSASFPNMTTAEVTQFVNGLFKSTTDLSAFKTHIRDFLIQSKEFSAQIVFFMVRIILGACLSLCHMLKACRKILPPPPATTALFEQQPPFSVEIQLPPPPPPPDTLYALFKQQSPFSVEIQLPPPPPPPLSSSPDNDLVEELPQLPSPPLSAYEELPPPPTLLSPPTLPSPSTPVPWRRQLPRVGGLYPPVGWYTQKQWENFLGINLPMH